MNSSTRMTHSPSSSGVSSCYSEMDTDRYDGEEFDEEDAFISFTTTESKCERLYEQGLQYKCMGELEQSLTSFSKCLEGVHSCQYFAKLPQTLHQLSDLSRAVQLYEQAEAYSKAEGLFYEAVTAGSSLQTAREGGDARQKTKRRPFGKKPKVAKSPASNPAEYDSLLRKKANEFDRLARACAEEGKFNLAMDYGDKAVTIKESVLGQKCHSRTHSMDYFRMLYSEARASAGTGVGKGDLSNTSVENGSSQSACIEACSSTTSDGVQDQEGTTPHLSNTQTFSHKGNFPDIPLESTTHQHGVTTSEGVCEMSLDRRPLSDQCCRGTPTPLNYKLGLPVNHECGISNIQRDTRPDMLVNGIDSCWKVQGKGQGGQPPLQEINVCVGMTTNITKLKNPMCVNLDLHKGPGEGTEPTRCLPMWILLLPALLALVTYMLYYH